MTSNEFDGELAGGYREPNRNSDLEERFERALARTRDDFAAVQRENTRQMEAISNALIAISQRLASQAVELETPTVAPAVGSLIPDRAVREPAAPQRAQDVDGADRANFFQAAAQGAATRALAFEEAGPSTAPASAQAFSGKSNPWEESSPFVDQVRWEPVPVGFREPRLPTYTGKDDPVSHLQAFEAAVAMRTLTDPLRCKLFVTSLGGEAREWFFNLPPRSIYSFADLRREILLRFATSRKRKGGPASLFQIKQRDNESLAAFVARFQEEILSIRDVGPFLHQVAFINALRPGPLKWKVTTKEPRSYQDLIAIVNRFIEGEICNPDYVPSYPNMPNQGAGNSSFAPSNRYQRPTRQDYHPNPPKGRNFRNHPPAASQQRLAQWQQPIPAQPLSILPAPLPLVAQTRQGFDNSQECFAELPLPVEEILEIIQKQPFYKRPAPMKSDVKFRNPSLYCEFHKERGHLTEDCRALRFLIERLLKEGKLQDLLAKKAEDQVKKAKTVAEVAWECEDVEDTDTFGILHVGYECVDADDEGEKGMLFCIHGGTGLESSKKSSISRVFRSEVLSASSSTPFPEVITFSKEDMPPHGNPFNDALVIKAVIEGFTVERILVDTGSSVNLLFKPTFDALKTEKPLLSTEGPLYGFSGERKEVEGRVTLTVMMGKVAKQTEFVVVDAPSSYYAIFGRPVLNQYGAVVSTYHLALKFSAQGKQFRVRSDPKLARECYVKTVSFVDISSQLGVEGVVLIPLSL